ncbi:fascin domain-containing protein [Photorhabdus antumapuensis]|uniref:fascin domain-containing protein n=1 Tax=Photorhabdus antumapuensis TaxID=2862867 RepID=UPI001CED94E1|nr:hypothetical protein [Photorhabdus antumapuensis]
MIFNHFLFLTENHLRRRWFSVKNKIALRASNGLYLNRVSLAGGDYIAATKSDIDIYSTFTLEYIDDNVIALCADNGKYLSRINAGGIFNYIRPDKYDLDLYCQFKVIKL